MEFQVGRFLEKLRDLHWESHKVQMVWYVVFHLENGIRLMKMERKCVLSSKQVDYK